MAINFLNNLNFNSIQVENIVIENFASNVLAGTGVSGQIYWNTTTEGLYGWDGTAAAWIPIGTQADVLTFAGGTGTGTVDLNAQTFTVGGTSNEIKTSGAGQTLTISLADGAFNATPGAGSNLELPNGTVAITQSAGDDTTKVATTAYVATAVAASDTLAEVLAVGNTTGGTDLAVSAGDDITFTDTSKAIFGTSADGLEIYHDGSNSYIKDSGTGDLYVEASANFYVRNNTNGEVWIQGSDSGVSLRYQDAQKLITKTGGIDITGGIYDKDDSLGSAGQYLTNSTGTEIVWATLPTYDNYDGWFLTGTSAGQVDVITQADITISGDGVTAVAGGTGTNLTLTITNTDKGTDQDAFKTFSMSGTNSSGSIVADTNEDTGILAGTGNQINIVGGTKTATWSLASGSVAGTRLNLTGTPFAPTATSGTDTDQIATTAFVQAAMTGLLEFKGGFNANTGILADGSGDDLYTDVALSIGDYYVVTVAGDFFGNTATPLTPGDSVIVQLDAAAGTAVEADFIVVQSDTDLSTYATVGLGNVNVESDTGIAAGYHGSASGAATGGVLNVTYTTGTADIALRESTASALGIVSVVEGSGIDVAYSNGAATISIDQSANPSTKLIDLDSADAWITRTYANGITTYDIEVDNANVFDTGVLSANVIGEVQVLNALAFTGASVGMTVYAEMTRAVSDKLRVAFAGDSTDNYYKVWLTRMA